jgi:hypothetical protein
MASATPTTAHTARIGANLSTSGQARLRKNTRVPAAHDAERQQWMTLANSIQVGRELGGERQSLLHHRPALAGPGHHEHHGRHRDQPSAGDEREVARKAVGTPLLLQQHEDAQRGDR